MRNRPIAHCGHFDASLDGGRAASFHRMADDDCTGGAGGSSRVVIGPIVDDDQQIDARDGAACAHSTGNIVANIVGWDDGCHSLRSDV